MSDIAIRVENLSKLYRIGGRQERYKTLRESLTGAVTAPFRRLWSVVRGQSSAVANETIWALKDVSFEVQRGEVVGIIGRNGAGKTTLLKVLSRITEPTKGYAEIHGRVGSLLEVGTGFHPELTGRENIYLNGAILGMKRAEIDRKFDEIVAFAEIEKFISTPVKHYSSGMHVRLAFAVAAHLEPEILLVDEVLAVGDVAFQRKCLGKMEDVSHEGRTVLFVSHNMAAISHLCERAVLLDLGRIVRYGDTSDVVSSYLEMAESDSKVLLVDRRDRKGSGELRVQSITLRNGMGEEVKSFRVGETAVFELAYESSTRKAHKNVRVGFPIDSILGQRVSLLQNEMSGFFFEEIPPKGRIMCKVPQLPLVAGRYHFSFCITLNGIIADWVIKAGILEITAGDFFDTGRTLDVQDGIVVLKQVWQVEPELEPVASSF